jgi:hypothetical protein
LEAVNDVMPAAMRHFERCDGQATDIRLDADDDRLGAEQLDHLVQAAHRSVSGTICAASVQVRLSCCCLRTRHHR